MKFEENKSFKIVNILHFCHQSQLQQQWDLIYRFHIFWPTDSLDLMNIPMKFSRIVFSSYHRFCVFECVSLPGQC